MGRPGAMLGHPAGGGARAGGGAPSAGCRRRGHRVGGVGRVPVAGDRARRAGHDHPHGLGVRDRLAARSSATAAGWGATGCSSSFDAADVVLAVGCRFSSWLGSGGRTGHGGAARAEGSSTSTSTPRRSARTSGVAWGSWGTRRPCSPTCVATAGCRGPPRPHSRWRQLTWGRTRTTWPAWSPCCGELKGPITQARLAKEVGDFLADKNYLVTVDGG